MTLAELEAQAIAARDRYLVARARLEDARRAAQAAIRHYADVHARVVGGAGAPSDVDAARAERNAKLDELRRVQAELT